MSPEHERYQADLAAHLLGSLSPEESAELDRHVEGCESCQRDVRWLKGAIDVLPITVEQLVPPPELRERLMSVVRAEAADATTPKRARERRRFSLDLLLRPATAAAAGALIVAAIVGYAIGGGGGGPHARTIAASASGSASGANAQLVVRGDSGILKVARLPQQPPRHVYELWIRHGKRVEPSSLLVVRRDGSGEAAIPSGLRSADELMVTLERSGGVEAPTSDPVLRAKV